MIFSRHLVFYTYIICIVKLGVINKKNKKPSVYKHSNYRPYKWLHPINSLLNDSSRKPEIAYRIIVHKHCSYLWRISATYLNCIIDFFDNNLSGVFLQFNLHPDLARLVISLCHMMIIVAIALHFSSNYDPASWEPIAKSKILFSSVNLPSHQIIKEPQQRSHQTF